MPGGIVVVPGRGGFAPEGDIGVGAGPEDLEFIEAGFVLIVVDGREGGEAHEAGPHWPDPFDIAEGTDRGAQNGMRQTRSTLLEENRVGGDRRFGLPAAQDDPALHTKLVDSGIEETAPAGHAHGLTL